MVFALGWAVSARAQSPEVLWLRCVPPAIHNNGFDAARIEVAVSASVTGVRLPQSIRELLVAGRPFLEERLYDDGTHGDAVAGDKVFSLGPLTSVRLPEQRGGRLDRFHINVLQLEHPGGTTAVTLDIEAGALLGLVDAGHVTATRDDSAIVRHSPRAAGVVVDRALLGAFGNPAAMQAVARQFYGEFGDSFDFLYLFPDRGLPGDDASRGWHAVVRSDVAGIGLPAVDEGILYGSANRLRGVNAHILSPGANLLRETMRQWAVYLNPQFGFGVGAVEDFTGFWGYAGVPGSLGGFDPATLVQTGATTWEARSFLPYRGARDRTPYAPVELYLAGLAAPAEVDPILVLDGARRLGLSGSNVILEASGVHTVSIDDVTAVHGARVPAYDGAVPEYRAAFILVSTDRVSDGALMFIDALAAYFADETAAGSEHTFYTATGSRARVNVVLDADLLLVTPSPTSTPTTTNTPTATGTNTPTPTATAPIVDWRDLYRLSIEWEGDAGGLLALIERWHTGSSLARPLAEP